MLSYVESLRPDEPGQLEAALDQLDQLDQLVVKPVDGPGLVIGPHADQQTLDRVRKEVVVDPRGWIAQRPVALFQPGRRLQGHLGARPQRLKQLAGQSHAWIEYWAGAATKRSRRSRSFPQMWESSWTVPVTRVDSGQDGIRRGVTRCPGSRRPPCTWPCRSGRPCRCRPG
ncbi:MULTISPECIES: circularly permuted type 2 ATP-grasp protein [unclassified Streptomyces]|uniref:circularly permuted type 2 ATP-grasp protein n=1 Tax=unclassified Streptomyces TaxID=2593676 RepID=UPI003662B5DF